MAAIAKLLIRNAIW